MQINSRIQHIDAWRFIAIALVLISHIGVFSHPWYREHFPFLIWRLQGLGTFGVHIFFCISGYVICRGLMHEHLNTGSVSIKGFYARRAFRIFPPILLYMLALVVLSLAGQINVTPIQFAQAGLFLCNVDVASCGWFLGHTWSLAYEEQFYLVFPILFVTFATMGSRRSFALLTIAVMVGSLAARYFAYDLTAEYASTFGYMLTGCLFAMYWTEIAPVLKRLPMVAWVALLVITPTLACLVELPSSVRYFFVVAVAPPVICAVVLGTPVSSAAVAKFFMNPAIAHLGKVSFTIYLWQQLATASYPSTSPLFAFVALAGVILVALLSYRYFELPLIRLGHSYSNSFSTKRRAANVDMDKAPVV